MKLLPGLLSLLITVNCLSQQPAEISVDGAYYSDNRLLSMVLKKVEGSGKCYKASFPYSSVNLCFTSDSTFVFYYLDIKTYDMSVGKLAYKEGVYLLASDSLATAKAVNDPGFYKIYFRFKTPAAMKIEKAAYTLEAGTLVPFLNTFDQGKIELLYSSRDFFNPKRRMSVYKNIQYDISGKSIMVDYEGKAKVIMSLDSLWGFVTLKSGTLKFFRVAPKGFNWYNYPGAQVVHTDPFIIYTIGEGQLYNYFSRDLNSKIYPLDASKVKMVFHDKPVFIEALTKEIPANRSLSVKGKAPNTYRILEIYKETEALKAAATKEN